MIVGPAGPDNSFISTLGLYILGLKNVDHLMGTLSAVKCAQMVSTEVFFVWDGTTLDNIETLRNMIMNVSDVLFHIQFYFSMTGDKKKHVASLRRYGTVDFVMSEHPVRYINGHQSCQYAEHL